MFSRKIIIEILVPTFFLDFVKVALGISGIDFWGKIFMSSDRSQNLQNKFLFNLRRRSTLYNFCFRSYGQNKMSKNVTLWQNYVDKPIYLYLYIYIERERGREQRRINKAWTINLQVFYLLFSIYKCLVIMIVVISWKKRTLFCYFCYLFSLISFSLCLFSLLRIPLTLFIKNSQS